MALTSGTTLGAYKILVPIGAGGMGEVYKARDTRLDRTVAIKVLPSHLSSDTELRGRFEREARAASALNHPNITTVYDIGEEEGTRYIVMEFVDGKTLRELVGDGPLATKKLLALATQIADGLAKAHKAGIVHRDLKPANLMVTEDGLVKILDFGIAKLMPQSGDGDSEKDTMTRATQQGAILGTPQYMSPEQAAGRPVDYRSDQFSFGSILYEMATGRLAFKKDSMPQTLTAIIETEPEPIGKLNDKIPAELAAIVERCLAKDLEKRYESTAELASELKNVPETSRGWRSRRHVLWAAAGLLAAFLAFALGPNLVRLSENLWSRTKRAPVESIAVLPLRNLSGDPAQEYLADGMTEALIADLAKIGALKVISRTSVMRYKDSDKALGDIASELNVDVILEGSVLRVGDRVRITAQLIDVHTDQALWAETYERDLRDLLVLQSEVARAVAEEIEVVVTPEETNRLASARPVNPEAHEAYLTGRFHQNKLTPADIETALSYFELALEKNPDYTLAYVGIASVWGGRLQMGFVPSSDGLPLQREAIVKALELDDSLTEVHIGLAALKTWGDYDWPAAERAFERAIELNANSADARTLYSHFLNIVGRPDEAMAQIERALELDPLNAFSHAFHGVDLNFVHRYDEAIEEFRYALRLTPGLPFATNGLSLALHLKGAYEEAVAAQRSYLSAIRDVEGEAALAEGYAEGGYTEAMRRLAETRAERSLKTDTGACWLADLYIRAGENELALEWLERAFANRDPNMPYLLLPHYDSVRDHPRFQDLLRRMNLPL
ncbi:MAG: tetratricopeptide repeat protein [Acidobacteria bacterium]|nr:MAG: tetratricopeptide repeat protein [Acidobacteriota bacterium]